MADWSPLSDATTGTSSSPGQTRGGGNLASILGNVLSLTLGAGTAQALMAAAVLLTARQLGTAKFGEYSASFSAVGLAAILFNLGLDTWLLRNGAHGSEQLRTSLGKALAIKMVAGIPWMAGIIVILPRLNPGTFHWQLVLLSAVTIWVEGFFTIGLSVFKALLRNQVTALLLVGARGGTLLLTVLLIAAHSQEAAPYAWVRLAAGVIGLLVTALLLPVKPRASSMVSLRQAARESLPFALSDLLTSVYMQADVTITAILLTKESVGLYAPASSLINALFVIPSAGYSVMVPVLVRQVEAKSPSLNRVLGLTIASFAVGGIILWVGAWYVSSVLPRFILGNSFEKSGPLLAILSPIIFLKSCSFAAAALLVAVGWQNRRTVVQAASAIANVALNLAIIHRFGVTGVAVVYVVSELLLTVGYMGLVIRWVRRVDAGKRESLP